MKKEAGLSEPEMGKEKSFLKRQSHEILRA
jgi:hypothetical protein